MLRSSGQKSPQAIGREAKSGNRKVRSLPGLEICDIAADAAALQRQSGLMRGSRISAMVGVRPHPHPPAQADGVLKARDDLTFFRYPDRILAAHKL